MTDSWQVHSWTLLLPTLSGIIPDTLCHVPLTVSATQMDALPGVCIHVNSMLYMAISIFFAFTTVIQSGPLETLSFGSPQLSFTFVFSI
jgi:hypothetical protein